MKNSKINFMPISDHFATENTFIDNEMAEAFKSLPLFSLLNIRKRSGVKVQTILFALLIWPMLGAKSIHAFCGKCIKNYIQGSIDTLYAFMRRCDLNWQAISARVALFVFNKQFAKDCEQAAFVVDDTLKKRRGKKVQGACYHFDHNENRSVFSQQFVQLGLSAAGGFLPLLQHLYISSSKPVLMDDEAKIDKRRSYYKHFQRAQKEDKHTLMAWMLRKALSLGFKAKYLLADSWYASKENLALALELGLTGIFQLKRNRTKYRFQGNDYTLKQLYVLVKRKMKRSGKGRYRTYALTVELSLPVKGKENRWTSLKLVFSSDVKNHHENWVVFVCTDTQMSAEEVLLAYSKRWAVEVYFKEIKQTLGFLKEQSGHFTVCYASMHLTAIRYMLLLNRMLEKGTLKFGQLVNKASGQIELLSFAGMLWEVFKALLSQALYTMKLPSAGELLETLQTQFEEFLNQALQMDEPTQSALRKAEIKGFL